MSQHEHFQSHRLSKMVGEIVLFGLSSKFSVLNSLLYSQRVLHASLYCMQCNKIKLIIIINKPDKQEVNCKERPGTKLLSKMHVKLSYIIKH